MSCNKRKLIHSPDRVRSCYLNKRFKPVKGVFVCIKKSLQFQPRKSVVTISFNLTRSRQDHLAVLCHEKQQVLAELTDNMTEATFRP